MGRQTTYTQKIADEILERIAEGEPLRVICRDEHMPSWRTVYDWRRANEDFATRFAHARDLGFDAIAEDTIEMVDTLPERTDTKFGDKVDAGWVQWQRNRVEQRLKLLAKWSPKKYGDKTNLELTGADGGPVQINETERATKIAAILATAKARKSDDASDLI